MAHAGMCAVFPDVMPVNEGAIVVETVGYSITWTREIPALPSIRGRNTVTTGLR